MEGAERFAAAITGVFGRLDWDRLGRHYCTEGGEHRFDEAAVSELVDSEIAWASRVVELVQARGSAEIGRSLYLGAALAELGPMFGEALLLGREILAFSLTSEETAELELALATVGSELGVPLPRISTADVTQTSLPVYDHLWLVSVLNDPEAFPALHDELYERAGTELATGRGDLASDAARATDLVAAALGGLTRPGLLTTTDEELPIVRTVAASLGLDLTSPTEAELSPLVGDPVRSWIARPSGPTAYSETRST